MTAPTAHDEARIARDDITALWTLAEAPDSHVEPIAERLEAYIATLEATIARLTAPIADEALRIALGWIDETAEWDDDMCREWNAENPDTCFADQHTMHRDTITTALNQRESERRRLVAQVEWLSDLAGRSVRCDDCPQRALDEDCGGADSEGDCADVLQALSVVEALRGGAL